MKFALIQSSLLWSECEFLHLDYNNNWLLLVTFRAVKAGADRLELCSNLGLGGGTTPTLGLLKVIGKVVPTVPIMVADIAIN